MAGWGLVTSTTKGFTWQGYLLGPFGLGGRTGAWAYANLGVLAALAIGFLLAFLAGRGRVAAQEARLKKISDGMYQRSSPGLLGPVGDTGADRMGRSHVSPEGAGYALGCSP